MSAPHEAGAPSHSLVRAVFAPDFREVQPERPALADLVIDNYEGVGRTVWVELGGPLAVYATPDERREVKLLAHGTERVPVKIATGHVHPEGGHHYDLTAVVTDPNDDFLYTCSLRVAVVASADIERHLLTPQPTKVTDRKAVKLRVRVKNTGNVPLTLDVARFPPVCWIRVYEGPRGRRPERRWQRRVADAERLLAADRSRPRMEELRPDQRQANPFTVMVTTPSYLVGFGRILQVPLGIRGDRVEPELAWVDVAQDPLWRLERRQAVLGAAVLVALLVLGIFMGWLATR